PHHALGVGQIRLQLADVAAPVLADAEDLASAEVRAQVVEPVAEEARRDVLDGVEAEAVDARDVDVPAAPREQVLADLGVIEVDVAAHQVVEVAVLERDLAAERLADLAEDLVDARLARVGAERVEVLGVP